MDGSIARRDRIADEYDELYASLYSEEIARQKADYEATFGQEYRAAHPFKPNGVQAHLTAMHKIAARLEE